LFELDIEGHNGLKNQELQASNNRCWKFTGYY